MDENVTIMNIYEIDEASKYRKENDDLKMKLLKFKVSDEIKTKELQVN